MEQDHKSIIKWFYLQTISFVLKVENGRLTNVIYLTCQSYKFFCDITFCGSALDTKKLFVETESFEGCNKCCQQFGKRDLPEPTVCIQFTEGLHKIAAVE